MSRKENRPILLSGPGRSGTTLLYRILSNHPDVTFFSNWSNRFPNWPTAAVLNRLRVPVVESLERRFRGYPSAAEAWSIWNQCFASFWARNHRACDDPDEAKRFRHLVDQHLIWHGKTRFITKVTGPSMIGFFRSIYPEAVVFWMDRDPRAVTYRSFRKTSSIPRDLLLAPQDPESLLSRRWIPVPRHVLPEREHLRYASYRYMSVRKSLREEPQGFHHMQYEHLIESPQQVITDMLDLAGLPESDALTRALDRWPLRKDTNRAWAKSLDPHERELMESILAPAIDEFHQRMKGESPSTVNAK